ncbi:MAG: hypothetical protein ABH859_04365 [Pseudomonadota bacterium]
MSGVSKYISLLDPNLEGQMFKLAQEPRAQRPEPNAQIQPAQDQYQGSTENAHSKFQDILNGIKSRPRDRS